MPRQTAFYHAARHNLSAFGRKRGILVRVHSVLRESLTFGDISVHRSNRMDNLLKDHIETRFVQAEVFRARCGCRLSLERQPAPVLGTLQTMVDQVTRGSDGEDLGRTRLSLNRDRNALI